MGGDFDWTREEFHDPYCLQRSPTFMDIGQAHDPGPTKETSFPACLDSIFYARDRFSQKEGIVGTGYQHLQRKCQTYKYPTADMRHGEWNNNNDV